jgi:hypothetical protein
MAKPTAAKWPKLKAYWDAYGHTTTWDQLFDMKSSGFYAVVAWMMKDGSVGIADLAYDGSKWEMNNDGFEAITMAEWKKLKLDEYCETFEIAGKQW